MKRYFKEIKLLFPVYGEEEKKFIASYKADLDEYVIENPDSDYEQIILAFGAPNVVISRYIAEADPSYLSKKIRTAQYIKRVVAAVIIAAVVTSALIVTIKYINFVEGQKQYITREVIAITDETVNGEAVNGEAASGGAVSEGAVSTEAASGESVSGESVSTEAANGDSLPSAN